MYRNGAVIDIDPSASNAHAVRINDAGVIAGNSLEGFDGCRFRRTDLQPYPAGDPKLQCEYALAANQGIQVVGWVQTSVFGQAAGESHPPFGSRPVLWNNDTAHTPTDLPLLPGDNYGVAMAVNNAGQVVGTWPCTTDSPRRL